MALGERRQLDGVVGEERRLLQARLHELGEQVVDELRPGAVVGGQREALLADWSGHVHLMDHSLGVYLHTFGHLIQYIGRFMDPASLLLTLGIFFLKSRPKSKGSIANC